MYRSLCHLTSKLAWPAPSPLLFLFCWDLVSSLTWHVIPVWLHSFSPLTFGKYPLGNHHPPISEKTQYDRTGTEKYCYSYPSYKGSPNPWSILWICYWHYKWSIIWRDRKNKPDKHHFRADKELDLDYLCLHLPLYHNQEYTVDPCRLSCTERSITVGLCENMCTDHPWSWYRHNRSLFEQKVLLHCSVLLPSAGRDPLYCPHQKTGKRPKNASSRKKISMRNLWNAQCGTIAWGRYSHWCEIHQRKKSQGDEEKPRMPEFGIYSVWGEELEAEINIQYL